MPLLYDTETRNTPPLKDGKEVVEAGHLEHFLDFVVDIFDDDLSALGRCFLAQGEKHLMDRSRTYFRLLRKIIGRGQSRGELRKDFAGSDIVKAYAMWERALMYDWCLCAGEYSLVTYTDRMTPLFIGNFRAEDGEKAAD